MKWSNVPTKPWSPLVGGIPATKPRRDKLVIETEKAYRASNQYQIDKLIKLERRYATRLGKAEAGLRKTRRQLQAMLTKLAHEKMGEGYVP